ncbi:hypothetical protein DH2020_017251 [Rehmannia glutinosa]|uniref:Alpha/beta hydrolase fold-3 domain-containing protein n=1 Tax=Rehmannia glutinosa TaxID=99300 RepID=A0ABR0WRZ9_REHGL
MASVKVDMPLVTRLKQFVYILSRRFIFRSNGTINRRIYNLVHMKSPAQTTKPITTTTLVSTYDVPIDPSRNLWFRLFVPAATTNIPNGHFSQKLFPFILHFHGGGFSTMGPDSSIFDCFCSRLAAETRAVVASVNYRLAPEHRYPSQYEDGFDALKFIDSQNHAVLPANTDLDRCFIAGDSAGANIAHHVTVRACQNPHKFDKLKIVGLVSIQPFFGGEERTEAELRLKRAPLLNVEVTDRMWRSFLPEGADRDHPAVNVLKSAKLENVEFPSMLVVVGGYDPLQDWQRRYVEWVKEYGKEVELIEYPNAFHSFYAFPEVAEFQMLMDHVREFIRKK